MSRMKDLVVEAEDLVIGVHEFASEQDSDLNAELDVCVYACVYQAEKLLKELRFLRQRMGGENNEQ